MDVNLVTKLKREYPCKKCAGSGTRYDQRYLSETQCTECCGVGINWRKALTIMSMDLEKLRNKYNEALRELRKE